ncbi:Octanoyltransferase [Buchnera aphidicola (Cinara kochiana kochiana)]|uniref:Octanoyltransferase n=1 Tax=Buchnera aphidicola (Cinara kochiana kochiana) TaxID=2518976 RepID=A0A451D5F1_9GAMM|nr:lipoyl(octanoyl) transferase LipB [Buchnera aphidicola]VFP81090.1 Octanoyltransferase [Buchnera aphidicola (Cinara kochiana kochiana)]
MNIFIRYLKLCNWLDIEEKMHKFTKNRNQDTVDELWFAEHYPVFTYGISEKKYKKPYINGIPVFHSIRGGKITYHGPGQLIIYFLINLQRKKIQFYKLVQNIEIVIVKLLKDLNIPSHINKKWPGVYVKEKKICSLGFRIIKGCSLHGLSLNVNMNLTPFKYINPCGNKNVTMTQIKNFHPNITIPEIQNIFIKNFCIFFNYLIIEN